MRIATTKATTGLKAGDKGWGKPKGMHWRTYERLCDDHDTFEDVVNRSFITRFGPC